MPAGTRSASPQQPGAEIRCNTGGHVCGLFMEGHPLDGRSFGVAGAVAPLVDLRGEEGRSPALRAFVAVGGLERWIAEQRPWQGIPSGWTAPSELQGRRLQVKPAPGGVRVVASAAEAMGTQGRFGPS